MQIQISQQDAKTWVPYYASGIAALLLGIAEDFMPAKKLMGKIPSFSSPSVAVLSFNNPATTSKYIAALIRKCTPDHGKDYLHQAASHKQRRLTKG